MSADTFIAPGSAEADLVRRRDLNRMRAVATGLLVAAAVVYVATHGQDGFWGFVNAGAEASMVGAMADWFAVTALFRHPLGLPVPHTALIPRRKDDLGRGLQEFVRENFLAEPVLRERVGAVEPSRRVGEWLADPAHARRVVEEVSDVAVIALGKVRDEHVAEVAETVLLPRFREEPIAPLASALLTEMVEDDLHHGLVDLTLAELLRWLRANEETFTEVLVERAPWWSPPRLNDAVTQRIHQEAIRWVEDIQADPEHRARQAFDSMLHQLAHDLAHDRATAERAERLKLRVLDHPQVVATGVSLWKAFQRALVAGLEDPASLLRVRLEHELVAFGRRLGTDAELRARIDGAVAKGVVFAVGRYGEELTGVITSTIERWDGKEAARKIELHVGRDLQFIRINGTVVGGLVGVLIHTISVLIG
ncbi:DUF445 domain-containing protein [Nocardioides zeae]|uniref:DUF445 domain-containing protein n=1 Tax=Nocardioides imazamoxiresistens TaxID=3231893 RepID=A0ABU3PWW4_9ACTN|nr:DUF445 domain-containing protein [Nocardioides zeae]MDT9593723.1 DUF445 domain-containing protein [Nocardioides zeae]